MLVLLFGRGGWLAAPARALFGGPVLFALPAMALATALVSLPFMARELVPLLEQTGRAEEEAAATLGAGALATFWRVTLPNVRWGIAYGVTLTLARALGEFGAVVVVSGAIVGRTETATLFVYRAIEERQRVAAFSVALALALASVLLLLGVGLWRRARERRR
jgi:sulfate transport system permease protein